MAVTLAGGRDYLSYSAIALYRSCGWRFFLKYIAGMPEETVSASLVFGTAFHHALQHHFEQLMMGDRPPSLDGLLEVFWASWRTSDPAAIQFSNCGNLGVMADLAERMLRTFQASELANPPGAIVGIEEELRGPILPGVPDLLARLDLVIDTGRELRVIDFKTSKSRWNRAKVAEAAPQLWLYSELVRELANGQPLQLAFAVMTKAKTPRFELHTVPHEPEQVDLTKRIVEHAWAGIQRREFHARPSIRHCPQCPYRQACYAWVDRSA